MDPNDLALFAHVADAGSFTAAAERLNLPKSTLSRRLSALEARLGERLMQRTTRKLSVTEFGAAVLEHARQVVLETDGVLSLALHRQAEPSGRLRVSMPGDVAQLALGEALAHYVRDHPKVQLELDLSPRRVDLIAEGFDLVVRMGDLRDESQLSARRLATFDGGLFASPAWVQRHGVLRHPDDLLAPEREVHALVVSAQAGQAKPWALYRSDGQEAPPERWQGLPARWTLANSPAMVLQLAEAGVGVAAAAGFFAHAAVREGRLVPVLPDWQTPGAPCWAVFPERRLMPAKTRSLIDVMVAALAPCRALEAGPAFNPMAGLDALSSGSAAGRTGRSR
jgi:DNA-binding transcriptional LysR family regulator